MDFFSFFIFYCLGLTVKFEDSTDPHVVAGLLKLYVRELPDPLLPFESYNDFISINEVTGNFIISN